MALAVLPDSRSSDDHTRDGILANDGFFFTGRARVLYGWSKVPARENQVVAFTLKQLNKRDCAQKFKKVCADANVLLGLCQLIAPAPFRR